MVAISAKYPRPTTNDVEIVVGSFFLPIDNHKLPAILQGGISKMFAVGTENGHIKFRIDNLVAFFPRFSIYDHKLLGPVPNDIRDVLIVRTYFDGDVLRLSKSIDVADECFRNREVRQDVGLAG
jgi:hypothetical protein